MYSIQTSEGELPPPDFSGEDLEALKFFFETSQKYQAILQQELEETLKKHKVFGPMMKAMTPEQRKAQEDHSRELQRAAIYEGKWEQYARNLMEQGKTYASMNITYSDWYEIISLYKKHIIPHIKKDFAGQTDKAVMFLDGLDKLTDYAMYGIAEAYFAEKNRVIRELNQSLEKKVEQRTEELNAINKELEAFSYSVSHDLRGPLRAINGFTRILQNSLPNLSEDSQDSMNEIISNTRKMGLLIDSLLEFSRLGKKNITPSEVDMNELVQVVIKEIKSSMPAQDVSFHLKPLGKIKGDWGMLKQVFTNILSNSVKYSAKKKEPRIEIGSYPENGSTVYYVRDNGAGFDMAYYSKLFGVFQRLHTESEFEGTGVGLALAQRIVAKHRGKIWAEGKVDEGATFYFSIPNT